MAFSFSAPTATSQPSTGFSFGTTASAPAAQTGSLFGGGATTTSVAPTAFGSTPSANVFGAKAATSSTLPTFGSSLSFTNPTAQQTSFGGFGAASNTGGTSSLFAPKPTLGQSTFGNAFGGSNQSSLFGNQNQLQQQQQQQKQGPPSFNEIASNLFEPKIYNDERDKIVGLFNSLQAFWGFGKAYYSAFNPPYEFTETDACNRFKTIGYSEIRNSEEKDKIYFLLKISGDESQLKTNLLTYEHNLKQVFGTNFTVKLEVKNILPDSKALISFVVTENTTSKSIPEEQLRSYCSQPNAKQQLTNIFGGNFIEVLQLSLSKIELEQYLSTPPKGVDERLWTQAKLENPDPERFTPLPLVGFASLNNRFKLQEKEIQNQKCHLKLITDNVATLQSNLSHFKAKFERARRQHADLTFQVLKRMIAQEIQRKQTLSIQAEEDKLRADLEKIQTELSIPTKFQGCINELMSQLRQNVGRGQSTSNVYIDKQTFNEYKQLLMEENTGIMDLVNILKKDIEDIKRLSPKQT